MAEFFLVNKSGEIVKLNKGIPEAQVNELLGMEFKTEPTHGAGDTKRVYSFGSNESNQIIYKLLLRSGLLEWVMKVSKY